MNEHKRNYIVNKKVSIHPSIHRQPLIHNQVVGAAASVASPRLPFRGPHWLTLTGESPGAPRSEKRYNPRLVLGLLLGLLGRRSSSLPLHTQLWTDPVSLVDVQSMMLSRPHHLQKAVMQSSGHRPVTPPHHDCASKSCPCISQTGLGTRHSPSGGQHPLGTSPTYFQVYTRSSCFENIGIGWP